MLKILLFSLAFMSTASAQQNFQWGMFNKCSAVRDTCLQHLKSGCKKDGVYRIRLTDNSIIKTYCDQTTDGGGWTLVAYNRGSSAINSTTGVDRNLFVSIRNSGTFGVVPASLPANTVGSLNIEAYSIKNNTTDARLVAPAYAGSPFMDKGFGTWNYNTVKCSGNLLHTARTAGCSQNANDNYNSADMLNIAMGNEGIVPYYRESGQELCYSGKGWCSFEFYLR